MFDKITKYVPLNFPLLANPVNWLIVALTIALGGVALACVITSYNASFAQDDQNG